MNQDTVGRKLYWQYRKGERTLRELGHLYRIPPSALSRQFRQRDDRMLIVYGVRWLLQILRSALPEEYEFVRKHATEHNLTRVRALAELECTVWAFYQEKRKDPVKFLRKKLSQRNQLRTQVTKQLSIKQPARTKSQHNELPLKES